MPKDIPGTGKQTKALKEASKLGLDRVGFTLIVCMDKKTAKCCSATQMDDSWKHLKKRVKLWRTKHGNPVLRIKALCLGVCKFGPLIGVFPDGVWYGGCTPNIVDRIFDEHLENGKIVKSNLVAKPSQNVI